MIRSMTAFTRREINSSWGIAVWELRSLNQRYLDICIRLPEQLRLLEPTIRDRIRTIISRGKIECDLHVNGIYHSKNNFFINKILARQLIKAAQWVQMQSNHQGIDPLAILSWPGVLLPKEEELNILSVDVLTGLDDTLQDFLRSRETEGVALKSIIEQRLAVISIEIAKIRNQMPAVITWQRAKLISKLEVLSTQLSSNRLEQELLILAQRIDVAEELDRIEVHIKEIYKILSKHNPVGRRLDFLMQELNRESNTLASKSINTDITSSAIEIKVLIEQMREQIQNIE